MRAWIIISVVAEKEGSFGDVVGVSSERKGGVEDDT